MIPCVPAIESPAIYRNKHQTRNVEYLLDPLDWKSTMRIYYDHFLYG